MEVDEAHNVAPPGHEPNLNDSQGLFTNIYFVVEDEPPVRSCIRRVQDLDVSDYTEKESID